MFVGHLALGLAAKRIEPDVSLGWFIAAVVTLDLIWPILVLAGVEHVRIVPGATAFTPLVFDSYPWSHSLSMSVVWGMLLAILAVSRGHKTRTGYLLAALVVSHWVLDFVTHAKDMPLWRGESPKFGLGLWNSIPGTLVVEGSIWIAAILIYLRARSAKGWIGPVAFWSFVAISTAMWLAGPWIPPPPDARTLAWGALIGWITIPWTALADRYLR